MGDHPPVLYCVIDRQGRFLHVSQPVTEFLGYDPGELTGRPFLDFVADGDKNATLAMLEGFYRGSYASHFTHRFYHKEGHAIPIRWSCRWDAEAQQLYCFGHALREGLLPEGLPVTPVQTKLSETLERITAGICGMDREARCTYANQAALTILRMAPADLIGRVLWEVFPRAVGAVFEQEYKQCVEEQVPASFEAYYPEPLNRVFEVQTYPSVTGVSVIFRDITARKQVEEEVNKLALIVRHTDNIVLLCDAAGRIKWVNEAFERKTGYTLAEAAGKRPGDLLAGPETDQRAIERLREQYSRGEHFHAELQFYTRQRRRLWVDVTGKIIYDEQGRVKELFSIQTDITEKKMLEERLAWEKEQRQRQVTTAVVQALEQEFNKIGRELHDNVNQLLTTAKLYLEVSRDPALEGAVLVDKSIATLQAAISEIRQLSRQLVAPAVTQMPLAETLRELCENVADCGQFRIWLDRSGIEGLEVAEELHLAMYRILQEQLTNILKHAGASEVQVTACREEGLLVLSVRDNGRGFNTAGRRPGIGIANMQARAAGLNGTLTLTSAPGTGCLLVLHLPLKDKGRDRPAGG